jgi:hypothetical protein
MMAMMHTQKFDTIISLLGITYLQFLFGEEHSTEEEIYTNEDHRQSMTYLPLLPAVRYCFMGQENFVAISYE